MSYVEGISREQRVLFPRVWTNTSPRKIPYGLSKAFVEGLEMEELGFGRSAPKRRTAAL